jgi:1-acyl-sn-glycerol-3-phosphate acyltransferase
MGVGRRIAELNDASDQELLTRIIRDLVTEIHPDGAGLAVRPDSRLDTELALDSLAVVELRSRVEDAFAVVLPDRILSGGTPDEWLSVLRAVRGGAGPPACAGRAATGGAVPAPATPPGTGVPEQASTLLDALAWHVRAHPARPCVRLLGFGTDQPPVQDISYGRLSAGATAVAGGLRRGGLAPGGAVAIMLPTGPEYFTAFLGTLLAGGVAVPIYPPARRAGLEEHLRRQAGILRNALAVVLITVPEARTLGRLLRAQVPSLRQVVTTGDLPAGPAGALPAVAAADTALLQYTSGSTGDPKGVILTHHHLLANIRAMGGAADAGPGDLFVSWLPLYHDMGLIGAWLAGLYYGFPLAVMSPLDFMACPARWLRAISDQHATLSAAPNFGYELCLRRISDQELAGVDLSAWRLAFDGSETVSPATISRFTARFAPYGLRPEAMTPAYGLAEAGLAVTFPPLGRGPLVDTIGRAALARAGQAVPATGQPPPAAARRETADTVQLTSCGGPLPGYQLRVVDAAGWELGERREGRIEFAGPSATPGYFRNEAATRALRRGPWVDTGDLGYLAGGELYLTGRVKDIIVRRGRNLHPDETEEAIGQLPGVEHGGVAVFGCPDPGTGTERLVLAAETRLDDSAELAALRGRITALAATLLGVPPDEVALTAPGSVPKTASGKTRRAATRERYLAGTLGAPARAARWQVARFAAAAVRPGARAAARSAGSLLYAGYAWAMTTVVGVPAWLLIVTLPRLRARWAVLRGAARLLRRLLAIRVTVTGQPPERASPFVAVANHASFIDGLILVLCLPGPVCFAAAGKFAAQRIAGLFLRQIGAEFVYGAQPHQATASAAHLAAALASGRSLAVWPEGALDPAPGLRPFHLGAFEAAASTGSPVIPVGIHGTRDVLRPGTRFPRRAAVHVTIGAPIQPVGTGWPAAVALRDQARAGVLARSAEPDIASR